MKLDLIFFGDEMLISKRTADWEIWQSKLFYYKSSLTFNNPTELLGYLKLDYNLPDTDIRIIEIALSDISIIGFFIKLQSDRSIKLDLESTNLDIIGYPGELGYWRDGEWTLRKQNDDIFLCVFLNGHMTSTKEIKLSAIQTKALIRNGKKYAQVLAIELQRSDSIA